MPESPPPRGTGDLPRQMRVRLGGHVQGVGFRFFARRRASLYGVSGYVRNMHDGTVEVVAQGAAEVLEMLLDALKRGPSGADVQDVQVTWEEPSEVFRGFDVRH